MAAHALRNPLSAIRMAAATLQHPRRTTPLRAAQHEVIQRQSAHMARLIDDLLDGSRVGTGAFRLRCSHLELGRHPQRGDRGLPARDRHQATAPARRARAEAGDRVRRPAAADPGVRQPAQQRLAALAAGGRHPARDGAGDRPGRGHGRRRGVGIAPDALPHIFDLFALDTNLPIDESGLGIGLAVVHELVKAHGGTVAARSAGKDLGSEFIVRLPLAGAAA